MIKLTTEQIEAIKFFNKKFPFIAFGGSLSLYLYGVINRQVKDLDLLVTPEYAQIIIHFLANHNHFVPKPGSLNDIAFAHNTFIGYHSFRTKKNTDICLFVIKELNFRVFNFNGTMIKLQDIEEIISIKQMWIDDLSISSSTRRKHEKDVKQVDAFCAPPELLDVDDLPF